MKFNTSRSILCALLSASLAGGYIAHAYATQTNAQVEDAYGREEIKKNLLEYQPDSRVKTLSFKIDKADGIKAVFSSRDLPQGTMVIVKGERESYTYAPRDGEWDTVTLSGKQIDLEVHLPELSTAQNEEFTLLRLEYAPQLKEKTIIGGVDERKRLACFKRAAPEIYSHGLSSVKLGSGSGSSIGTDNMFLTNHHVFSTNADVLKSEIWFNWHHLDCDESKTAAATPIKLQGEKLLVTGTGGSTDFSLFSADSFDVKHSNVKRLFGGLQISKGKPEVGAPLYIPQYGNGGLRPTYVADQHESGHCAVVRYTNVMHYNCDTQPGSSGSPVLSQTSHQLVGVHYGGYQSTNVAVPTDTLWRYLGEFVNDDNNKAVRPVAYPVNSRVISISPFSVGGEIGTFNDPVYVSASDPEQKIRHEGNRSLLTMVKKDTLTGQVTEDQDSTLTLWLENKCGQSAVNQILQCSNPGVTKLKYSVEARSNFPTPIDSKKYWLPLSIHDASNSVLSELVVRFNEDRYDAFKPPFDENKADVYDFGFSNKASKFSHTYTFSPTLGFTSFYAVQGPTSLVWSNKTKTVVPVILEENTTKQRQQVLLDVSRSNGCSIFSMNSTASCGGNTTTVVNVEFSPQRNANLQRGQYHGILPLRLQDWKDDTLQRNTLIRLQFDNGQPVTTAPVADAGGNRTVVGTSNFGFSYKLDGGKSQGERFLWEVMSGPGKVRKGTETSKVADAIIEKNVYGDTVYRLTVTGKDGSTRQAQTTISSLRPAVTINGGSSVTNDKTLTLQAATNFQSPDANRPVKYQWKLMKDGKEVGGLSANGARATLNQGLAAGRYQVSVVANSDYGMRSATQTHQVDVSAAPQIDYDQNYIQHLSMRHSAYDHDKEVGYNFNVMPFDKPHEKPESQPIFKWTLPSQASGILPGDTNAKSFNIAKTEREQKLDVSVKVTVGKHQRTLKATIVVPPKAAGDDGGGSHPNYVEGTKYQAGDVVKGGDNRLYQCKPWPATGWCSGAAWAYAPGTGIHWKDAWTPYAN